MNWKKFLKPDWRKVVTFSFFSILFLGIATTNKYNLVDLITFSIMFIIGIPVVLFVIGFLVAAPSPIPLVENKAFLIVSKTILTVFYLILAFLFYLRYWNYTWIYNIPALFLFLPSILISYLIVWLYDKFRKPKKK